MKYAHPGESFLEHAERVASRTRDFCGSFGSGTWGYLTGIAHDWGKYPEDWQKYLLDPRNRPTHAPESAAELMRLYPEYAIPPAYCVYGHHDRLPDWTGGLDRFEHNAISPFSERLPEQVVPDSKKMISPLEEEAAPFASEWSMLSLWTRMIYSALVDADSLDAERLASPENRIPGGGCDSMDVLEERFRIHMEKSNPPGNAGNGGRLRRNFPKYTESSPGMFHLTFPPEEENRMLSTMEFALRNRKNNQTRVIAVLSRARDIDETARLFRKIFGPENVLAYYSEFHPEPSSASENWDFPIVVTTVRVFFESLLRGTASESRKIHNLARSILILDRQEPFPAKHGNAILTTLHDLVSGFGCSAVFFPASPNASFPDPAGTHRSAGELARESAEESRALCVVGSDRKCLELFRHLPRGNRFLFSARMCAANRLDVLKKIGVLLESGGDFRIAATDSFRPEWIPRVKLLCRELPSAVRTSSDGDDPDGFRRAFGSSMAFQYRSYGEKFRMTSSGEIRPLAVRYGGSESLIAKLRSEGPSRRILRALQPYSVNLPESEIEAFRRSGAVETTGGIDVQRTEELYHPETGVIL